MSDQTIFDSNSNGGNPPNPSGGASTPPNVPDNQALLTLLSEIKNERGEPKYKTLPEALNALRHSQEYIPTLTSQLSQKDAELASARAEAARVAELERVVQELTQRTPTGSTTPAGLTAEQIADLVERNMETVKAKDVAKQNTALVAASLQAALGTEAESKYNAKAAELGMSVMELNALTARSPKAVLAMFSVASAPVKTGSPTHSTVNTTGLTPSQETFISRNKDSVVIGSTHQDTMREFHNSNKMVEELHVSGKTVHDLSSPKEYFKYFGG